MRRMSLIDRRRNPKPVDTWKAVRNARGIWVVRDHEGNEPLRHVDPVQRLYAVHLAAKAPELKAQLAEISNAFRSRCSVSDFDYADKLTALAYITLFECQPLYAEVRKAQASRQQLEISLDEAA